VRVYRTLGGLDVSRLRQYLFLKEIEKEKGEGEDNSKGRKGRNPTKWDNKKRGDFKILDLGHRRIQLLVFGCFWKMGVLLWVVFSWSKLCIRESIISPFL